MRVPENRGADGEEREEKVLRPLRDSGDVADGERGEDTGAVQAAVADRDAVQAAEEHIRAGRDEGEDGRWGEAVVLLQAAAGGDMRDPGQHGSFFPLCAAFPWPWPASGMRCPSFSCSSSLPPCCTSSSSRFFRASTACPSFAPTPSATVPIPLSISALISLNCTHMVNVEPVQYWI